MNNKKLVIVADRFVIAVSILAAFFAGGTIGMGVFAQVSGIAPVSGFDLTVTGVEIALASFLPLIFSLRLMTPEEILRHRSAA